MKLLPVVILAVCLSFGCDSLRGPTGDTGPSGTKGEKGTAGDKGDTGPQGDQGPQGEKGDAVYTDISVDEDKGSLLITEVTWSYDPTRYLSKLLVKGLAKNVGTNVLEYVKIHTKAYDSSDQFISSDYGYVDEWDLNPGQEARWKIEDYYCDQKPSRVTFGYSFDVSVSVPAPKRSPASGGL